MKLSDQSAFLHLIIVAKLISRQGLPLYKGLPRMNHLTGPLLPFLLGRGSIRVSG